MKNKDEEYLKIFHRFEVLSKSIGSEQNFNVKINDYVEEAISLVNVIRGCSDFYSIEHEESNLLIYSILYDVIKLEIICSKKRSSTLLLYIQSDEFLSEKMESFILEDVSNIQKFNFITKELQNELNSAINRKRELGISSVLDKDIINRVINCYTDESFREYAKKKLISTDKDIESNNNFVKNSMERFFIYLDKLTHRVSEKEKIIKDIKKRIIALVLSICLFSGIGLGVSKVHEIYSANNSNGESILQTLNLDTYSYILLLIVSLFPPCGPVNLLYKLINTVKNAKEKDRSIELLYYDIRFIFLNCDDKLKDNSMLFDFSESIIRELSKLAGEGYVSIDEKKEIRHYRQLKSIDSKLCRDLNKMKNYSI